MKKLGIVEARKIWRGQSSAGPLRELAALRLLIRKKVIPEDAIERFKSMPYRKFLATRYWQIVRHAVLQRCGSRCVICNSDKSLQVHHRSYEYRGREHTKKGLDNVTVLCRECHKKFHGIKE